MTPTPGPEAAAITERAVPIITGHTISEAIGGGKGVTAVRVSPIFGQGRFGGGGKRIDCDLVCMGAGYTPSGQLACHGGARLVYDRQSAGLVVAGAPAGMLLAGSVRGTHALEAVVAEGRHAGWSARPRKALPPPASLRSRTIAGNSRNHAWPIFAHPKGKEFVDFDEDLQIRDITDAAGPRGYDDIELLKRYSTVGMGPSQGRHSALASVRLAARGVRAGAARRRHHNRPPAGHRREIGRLGRARLRASAPHADATPSCGGRRADDGRRRLDAAGLLCAGR